MGDQLGGDMDGKVLQEIFVDGYLDDHPLDSIESYEEDWDQEARYDADWIKGKVNQKTP